MILQYYIVYTLNFDRFEINCFSHEYQNYQFAK